MQRDANILFLKGIGTLFFFPKKSSLLPVHLPEDYAAVELGSRECDVQ
jgi:hypothetical protein